MNHHADLHSARVAKLQALAILDTPTEPSYDALTRVAGFVCTTPFAIVSLIDGDRLWFKAAFGLDAKVATSKASFCCKAADQSALLEVCDAQVDPNFASTELVTGALGIRFYAGVPLVVNGIAVGTLCVLDCKPNRLSEQQKAALQDLAFVTTSLLTARIRPFQI